VHKLVVAVTLLLAFPTNAEADVFCSSFGKLLAKPSVSENIDQEIGGTCKPGDIIALPTKEPPKDTPRGLVKLAAIPRYCDFSRTIYTAPDGLVYCVLAQIREEK